MAVAAIPAGSFVNIESNPEYAKKIGTGTFDPPKVYRGHADILCNFFHENLKAFIQTLRYSAEWTGLICKNAFKINLSQFSPYARSVTVLKEGTNLFSWQEEWKSISTFKNTFADYVWQNPTGSHVTFSKLSEDFCDLVSKTCEVFRWFTESKIFTVSSKVANCRLFLNGASMLYIFTQKVNEAINKVNTCHYYDVTLNKWKLVKHTALLTLGIILVIGAIFSRLYPPTILFCTTVSLIATYAQHFIEKTSYTVSEEKINDPRGKLFGYQDNNCPEAPQKSYFIPCAETSHRA
jgi:hypothetical protein